MNQDKHHRSRGGHHVHHRERGGFWEGDIRALYKDQAQHDKPRLPVEVCLVPSTVHVAFTDTCESLAAHGFPHGRKVALTGLRGEYESFQVVVRSPQPLRVELRPDEAIEPSWEAAYYVGFVKTYYNQREEGSGGGDPSHPGAWRPDPLLPLTHELRVPPRFTQSLWVTLKLDAPVEGTVELRLRAQDSDDLWVVDVPVAVDVKGADMPPVFREQKKQIWKFSEEHLHDIYDKDSPEFPGIVKKFKKMLYRHRLAPPAGVNDYVDGKTPLIMRKANLDFLRCGGDVDSEKLRASVAHMKAEVEKLWGKGWPEVYVYGMDEADENCRGVLRTAYQAFKDGIPDRDGKKMKVIAATNWDSLDPDFPMDAWVRLYNKYDGAQEAEWKAAGKEVWGYHCVEPKPLADLNTFIERPLIEDRLLFWLAASRPYDGWLYWMDDLWRACPGQPHGEKKHVARAVNETHPAMLDFNPANFIWCKPSMGQWEHHLFANGDGFFVYPGPTGPLASQRLEVIRDGLEDWEALAMLPQGGAVEKAVGSAVQGPTRYSLDPKAVSAVRLAFLNDHWSSLDPSVQRVNLPVNATTAALAAAGAGLAAASVSAMTLDHVGKADEFTPGVPASAEQALGLSPF